MEEQTFIKKTLGKPPLKPLFQNAWDLSQCLLKLNNGVYPKNDEPIRKVIGRILPERNAHKNLKKLNQDT